MASSDPDGRPTTRVPRVRMVSVGPGEDSFLHQLRAARRRWDADRIEAALEYLRLFGELLDELAPEGDLATPVAQLSAALQDIAVGNEIPAWLQRPRLSPGRPRGSTNALVWRAAVVAGVGRYPDDQRDIAFADIATALGLGEATVRAWWDRHDRGSISQAEREKTDFIRGLLAEVDAAPADVPFFLQKLLEGRDRPPPPGLRQERRRKKAGARESN